MKFQARISLQSASLAQGMTKTSNPARLEPAVGMLEEDPLHSLILALRDFEIVGRIEIKERDRLDRAVHVERAGVDHLVGARGSLLGTVGVEFDATAMTLDAGGDGGEGVAFADTRIQSHEPRRELEMLANTLGLRRGKRVVPETHPSFDSQGEILLSFS